MKLFVCQKSQFDLAEKIKNKNKNRTRASLFKSSEDGKHEICLMWPKLSVIQIHKLLPKEDQ